MSDASVAQGMNVGSLRGLIFGSPPKLSEPTEFAADAGRPTAAATVRLLEEENMRWAFLEEGLSSNLRSCQMCGFLCAPARGNCCEACGAAMPCGPCYCKELGSGAESSNSRTSSSAFEAEELCACDSQVDELEEIVCVPSHLGREAEDYAAMCDWARKVARASRKALVETIFYGLDTSGAGVLGSKAMYKYACICGYDCGKRQWDIEYTSLCRERDICRHNGIDLEQFTQLMEDRRFEGYCTDDELREILMLDSAKLLRVAGRSEIDWPPSSEDMKDSKAVLRRIWRLLGRRSQSGRTKDAWAQREEEMGEFEEGSEYDSDSESDRESDEEDELDESEEEDELDTEELERADGTLRVAPEVGSIIEVLYDDRQWYAARVTASSGRVATVIYLDDGEEDEVDFSDDFARLVEEGPVVDCTEDAGCGWSSASCHERHSSCSCIVALSDVVADGKAIEGASGDGDVQLSMCLIGRSSGDRFASDASTTLPSPRESRSICSESTDYESDDEKASISS